MDGNCFKILNLSQLEVLQSEIAEYEALKAHALEIPLTLKTSDITIDKAIVQILIKARIAAKISPKELAALTGISEVKIKEYEDCNYQNASFLDIIEVAEALGIKLRSGVFVSDIDDWIESKLAKVRHQHYGQLNHDQIQWRSPRNPKSLVGE